MDKSGRFDQMLCVIKTVPWTDMVFDRQFQRCPPQSGSSKHRDLCEYEMKSRLFHARHRLRRRLICDLKFVWKIHSEKYFFLKILNLIAGWAKSQFPGLYFYRLKIFKTKFEFQILKSAWVIIELDGDNVITLATCGRCQNPMFINDCSNTKIIFLSIAFTKHPDATNLLKR